MSVPFPSIRPSSRSFKLGAFPVKKYRTLSGVSVKRSFGNRPFAYELQLGFANIDDDTTASILNHYNNTSGGFSRFTLPDAVFSGVNSNLRNIARPSSSIRWEYAEPPQIESIIGGRSNVQVSLIGEIA
jgi:hypothetical protein